MSRDELLALADRVEAATGADSGLDSEIHHAILNGVGVGSYGAQPAYTASLDAALSLVPSGWNHGYSSRQGTEPSWRVVAQCWNAKPASTLHGEASTPALALTASSLRAIAGSLPD